MSAPARPVSGYREVMKHGRIVLDNAIDQFTLLAHAADPDAALDATGLDLRRLPPDVRASLYSAAAVFRVRSLRSSGDLTANKAVFFSAPELRTAGNISATHAQVFEIPQLQNAGNIFATSAEEFVAHELVAAGDIDAFGAANFEAQSLRTAGYINAYFTKCFRVLQLRECRTLRVPSVRIFVAPELRSASVVDALQATWIIAPLPNPGRIFAQEAGYSLSA
ncbi:MAG: hypothetical protein ACREIC_15545 [Limisphaerales bacterium]